MVSRSNFVTLSKPIFAYIYYYWISSTGWDVVTAGFSGSTAIVGAGIGDGIGDGYGAVGDTGDSGDAIAGSSAGIAGGGGGGIPDINLCVVDCHGANVITDWAFEMSSNNKITLVVI